jgi:hypothetical protein
MIVANRESYLDRGTKRTPMLMLRAISLGVFLVMTNELHVCEWY